MNEKFEIKLISKGVRELLKSEEISEICRAQAEAVAGRAGEGYEVEERHYPERSGYIVKADTYMARKDNSENNTLLKALQS